MPATIAQILAPDRYRPEHVQRVASRAVKPPIVITQPNPEWPERYDVVEKRIRAALGDLILDVAHTGSTSVPSLPAKDVIDIDLTLKDARDETSYVRPLEEAGLRFILREPEWYEHRFFAEEWPNPYHINVHVWAADSPEVVRHRIFRDWLLRTPADLELYAKIKREAAEQTAMAGESMMAYNERKEKTINEILQRAFVDLGYIDKSI